MCNFINNFSKNAAISQNSAFLNSMYFLTFLRPNLRSSQSPASISRNPVRALGVSAYCVDNPPLEVTVLHWVFKFYLYSTFKRSCKSRTRTNTIYHKQLLWQECNSDSLIVSEYSLASSLFLSLALQSTPTHRPVFKTVLKGNFGQRLCVEDWQQIIHKNFMLTSTVSILINEKRRTAACGFSRPLFVAEQAAPTPRSRLPGCFVQVVSEKIFLYFILNHTDKLSPVFGRPQGSPCQAYSTFGRANDSLSQLRRQFPLTTEPWAYHTFSKSNNTPPLPLTWQPLRSTLPAPLSFELQSSFFLFLKTYFQAISERFFKKKLQAENRFGFKNRHYQNAFFWKQAA